MGAAIRATILTLLLSAALPAQAPTITLNSATLTLDPQNSDGYSLQGTFSGLSFASAQNVILSVGQFTSELSIADLVRQPGTNIFTYQDSTGTAPSWLSSLTIDADQQTFNAMAGGIVLAGLRNPFAVQLGTESASACTMARVQAAGQNNSQTTWQLSAGDGNQEPCSMPAPPLASPPSVPVNTASNVQFQVAIQPTPNLDPTTVQLFQTDTNGQPTGPPLCTLQDNGMASNGDAVAGDGIYSCIASLTPGSPGLIPMLIQASAPPNALLSPGFSLLGIGPVTQSDVDALSAVNDAANSAWQENYAAYGDSAQARVQTLNALRNPAMSGVAKLGLLEDGLSIGVLLTSGMHYSLLLNRIDDGQSAAVKLPGIHAPAPAADPAGPIRLGASQAIAGKARGAAASSPPLDCGYPQRPVVKNNGVIVWKSPFFPEPTTATLLARQLQANGCPQFVVNPVEATIANAMEFPKYGTIIIDTHGGIQDGEVWFLTDEPGILQVNDPRWDMVDKGLIGACSAPGLNGVQYLTLSSKFFASLGPFRNTLTFASACDSAAGGVMASVFAANGGAYYGFSAPVKGTTTRNGVTIPGFTERIAPELFQLLLKNYTNASDAYQGVDHNPLPGEQLHGSELTNDPEGFNSAKPKGIFLQPTPQVPLFVLQPGNSPLAYLGNPVLSSPGLAPDVSYDVGPGEVLNLHAQLDGALSCNGVMNYHWVNSARVGHLTPGNDASGQQDDFTLLTADTTYRANSTALGIDEVLVDFYPDPAGPAVARACTAANVNTGQILRVVFDGQGTSQETNTSPGSQFSDSYSANLTWHAAWDVSLPDMRVGFPNNANFGPALPGTTVMGTTIVKRASGNGNCSGAPVINTFHGNAATAIPQSPYIGFLDPSPSGPSRVVPMWVEAFGGEDYRLCDGLWLPAVGNYGPPDPGYPYWDTTPVIVKFNLDLSQWVNQPNHSATIPVQGDFATPDGAADAGTVHWQGALTLTTRTAP